MIGGAQFSVHRSPSRSPARPFVIVLQSDDFKRMPSRVVAPLVLPSAMPQFAAGFPRIAPALTVLGRPYVLNPFDIATIGLDRLGDLVATFVGDGETKRRIQDALDAVLKPY